MPRWNSFIQFLQEADQLSNSVQRQGLVDELLREQKEWPWVEDDLATFIYTRPGAERVALNLDIIESDPPFDEMENLDGTNLWYIQRKFKRDDLLDYLLAVDDPMTPLRGDANIVQRIRNHWVADEYNRRKIRSQQIETSVLVMPQARPFPDWAAMTAVPRGAIIEHDFSSVQMGFTDRKLWVYTPPSYEEEPDRDFPLLILLDGQWMVGPVQVPYMADALIKHQQMQPIVIAMLQSGPQATRMRETVSNDNHYRAMLTELVPLLQGEYRIDSTDLGIGGAGIGAVSAAHSALKNSAVFRHLIMLSPPLGRGQMQQQLLEYADRFANADVLPRRIFQSVGRYEINTRFYLPGRALAGILERRERERGDIDYKFIELGSGHGLPAFKSVFPEALAHIFPGAAFKGGA